MPTAVITGASRGLGLALATGLADLGWDLVVDARTAAALARAETELIGAGAASVAAIPGDITDPDHRGMLAARVGSDLDLLVNNASTLGPSPLPAVADLQVEELGIVLAVNVLAPVDLTTRLLPALRRARGVVVNVSSDAAVEAYAGWGGYGASKAALDQWTAVLAVEEPELAVYAFDPGDMRTQLHQDAYPGEDISDRPLAETVVPALLRLVAARPVSARYQATDWADATPLAGSTGGRS